MQKITVTDITEDSQPAQPEARERFTPDQVSSGKEVTLHFELALADGEIIDSNFAGSPVTFRVGDGNLPPGFERVILGLRPGDEHSQIVSDVEAFGPRNPENIHTLPRFRFPADLAMEAGLMINFADNAGNEQAGVIRDFNADKVTIDFNHPLAGREIHFRVRVLSVNS